jgi:hypothetical protein
VIVAGPALVRDGFVQQRDDASMGDARQWLEGTNALLESARGCALAPAFACEAAGHMHADHAGHPAKRLQRCRPRHSLRGHAPSP